MFTFLLLLVGLMFAFSLQTAQETVSGNMVSSSLQALGKTIQEVYALGPDTQLYAEIDLPETVFGGFVSGKSYGFEVRGLAGDSKLLDEAKADLIGTLPKTPGRHLVRVRMRSDGKIEIGKGLRVTPSATTVSLFPGTSTTAMYTALNETYATVYLSEFYINSQYLFVSTIDLLDLENNVLCDDCSGGEVLASSIEIPPDGDFQFKAVITVPDGMAPGTIANSNNYARTENNLEGTFALTVNVKPEVTDLTVDIGTPGIGATASNQNNRTIYFAEAGAPETAYFQGIPQQEQRGDVVFTVTSVPAATIANGIKIFKITDPDGIEVVNLADRDIPFSYTFETSLSTKIGVYTAYLETNPTATKNTVTKTVQFEIVEAIVTDSECFVFDWLNTNFQPPGNETMIKDWKMENTCANPKTVDITKVLVTVNAGSGGTEDDGIRMMNLAFGGQPAWDAGFVGGPQLPGPPDLDIQGFRGTPYTIPGNTAITTGNVLMFDIPFPNDNGECWKFKFTFNDGGTKETPEFCAPPADDAQCITVDWSTMRFTNTAPAGSEITGFTLNNNCEKPVILSNTAVLLALNANNAQVSRLTYAGTQAFNGFAPVNSTIPHQQNVTLNSKSSYNNNTLTFSAPISNLGESITLVLGFPSGPNKYTSPVWPFNFNLDASCLVIDHATTQIFSLGGPGWNDDLADFSLTNICQMKTVNVMGVALNLLNNPQPLAWTLFDFGGGPPVEAGGAGGMLGAVNGLAVLSALPFPIAAGQTAQYNDLQMIAMGGPGPPLVMGLMYYFTGSLVMGDWSMARFPPWPQANMTQANCTNWQGSGSWDANGKVYTAPAITNICGNNTVIDKVLVNDLSGGGSYTLTTVNLKGGSTEYYDATGTGPGNQVDLTDVTVLANSSIQSNTFTFSATSSIKCRNTTIDLIFLDGSTFNGANIKDTSDPNCTGG